MPWLRVIASRLIGWIQRYRHDQEFADELRFHLEMEKQRCVDAGMSEAEARRRANLRFGGVERAREEVRDARGLRVLDTLWADLRHAARRLARRRRFAVVAVATLALGIGATTAISSVAEALLLRPLPYPESDRLVALRSTNPRLDGTDGRTARGTVIDWETAQSFDAVVAYRWLSVALLGDGQSEQLSGLWVTPGFEDLFGPRLLGRPLTDDDRTARAMVLGRGVWQRRFEGAPKQVGELADLQVRNFDRVGPTPHQVVGVAESDLRFPPLTTDFQLGVGTIDDLVDFWLPAPDAHDDRGWAPGGGRYYDVVARLRPGVSVAQAQQEMNALSRALGDRYPETNRGWGVRVVPLRDQVLGGIGQIVVWLIGGTIVVLLMACVNVASLLVAQGVARQSELSVRTALGASRWRLARLLLVEVTLLVLPALALGAGLAAAGIAVVKPWLPAGVPLLAGTGVNATVLTLTALVGVVTVVATGVVPAVGQSRPDLTQAGWRGGTGDVPTPSSTRIVNALVVGEVTLAVTLLVTTALLVRSAMEVARVNPGFTPERLLTATIALPENKFDWDHNAVFARNVIESVESLPGVREAAVVQGVPMRSGSFWDSFEVEGTPTTLEDRPVAGLRVISPGYFRVMQIPLVDGRMFTKFDGVGNRGEPRALIVSQALARRLWPGERAAGRRIRPWGYEPWIEVVGVVGDVRYTGLETVPDADVYYPAGLFPQAAYTLLARTEGAPENLVAAVRERIRTVDADAFMTDVLSMQDLVDRSQAPRRSSTLLLAIYGAIALTLVVVGVSSVVGQVVAYRRREVAIRSALGASAGRLAASVMGASLRATVVGLGLGLLGAAMTTRLLASWLFGIGPADPITWSGAVLVILVAGSVAAYVPARGATRSNPMVILRE